MIHGGCEAYLAHVVDKMSENQVQLLDVPIVRDFKDVYPEDLPKLPLDHESVFEIELTPGMDPISKAPYRMASAELK